MTEYILMGAKALLKNNLKHATSEEERQATLKRHNDIGRLLFGEEWQDLTLEEVEKDKEQEDEERQRTSN